MGQHGCRRGESRVCIPPQKGRMEDLSQTKPTTAFRTQGGLRPFKRLRTTAMRCKSRRPVKASGASQRDVASRATPHRKVHPSIPTVGPMDVAFRPISVDKSLGNRRPQALPHPACCGPNQTARHPGSARTAPHRCASCANLDIHLKWLELAPRHKSTLMRDEVNSRISPLRKGHYDLLATSPISLH